MSNSSNGNNTALASKECLGILATMNFQKQEIDFKVNDADGDSLVFELAIPLSGGSISDPLPALPTQLDPIDDIVFFNGFSLNNFFGNYIYYKFDNKKCIIQFDSVSKMTKPLSKFYWAIKIIEYKNGVNKGVSYLDNFLL